MVEATLFMDDMYVLYDGRVRQFLFVSEEDALLIDAGFPGGEVYKAVREITALPVKVVMTHGDMDHSGGLKEFGECYLNEKDWHLIKDDIKLNPLNEGDVFECGAYRLEAIEIPGHTYGSIAFADKKNRLLFAGDSVQKDGPIFMFGGHRNLDMYIESQRRLFGMMDMFDKVMPCHHDCPVTSDYIEKNLEDALALKNGELVGQKHPAMPCSSYKGKWTEFLYE